MNQLLWAAVAYAQYTFHWHVLSMSIKLSINIVSIRYSFFYFCTIAAGSSRQLNKLKAVLVMTLTNLTVCFGTTIIIDKRKSFLLLSYSSIVPRYRFDIVLDFTLERK